MPLIFHNIRAMVNTIADNGSLKGNIPTLTLDRIKVTGKGRWSVDGFEQPVRRAPKLNTLISNKLQFG